MNLIFKGRGVDLEDRLRAYAAGKLGRAERFFGRIIKMEAVFSEERNPRVKARHRVDVIVKTPRDTLRAHGTGADYFAAVDQAADRLEAQVKRFKDRLVDRSHRASARGARAKGGGDVEEEGKERPVIVRVSQSMKPMTPEEAVVELESSGQQFVFFTNAESMVPGVLYRRSDGAYGLIEAAR